MRKLVIAARFVLALGCFAGASVAYAGDCCKPKCEQNTCTKSCGSKCGSCKAKCDSCKPACKPKCDTCKPKCKPKCNPCKPKCDPCKPKCETKCNPCKPKCDMGCKPKCKQHTCTKSCEPKCQSKCDTGCKPSCEKKCPKPCCAGRTVGCYDACCPPQAPTMTQCVDKCTAGMYKHPYEACWHGDGMLADTGCCGTYLPCKTKCVTCETVCKAVEVCDPCNPCGTKVKYVYETVCHEIMRPRVIPWWFNENGDGNIYLEDEPEAAAES
jgi:hypothetical protein